MALTIAGITYDVEKNKRVVKATVTFDASYPTGGESLDIAALSLKQVDDVVTEGHPSVVTEATETTGGHVVLGGTNVAPKLMLYSSGSEVSNASDQSGVIRKVRIYGS